MAFDDIEIHHDSGKTIVRGAEVERIKKFRDQCRQNKSGALEFTGVKRIDRIRPDGTPHQTIYGNENTQE